jgi:hypothetical protein
MLTVFYSMMRPFAWALWLVSTAPRRARINLRYRRAGSEKGLVLVEGSAERRFRMGAVVCVYYHQDRSVSRLLSALWEQGVDVVLVANRPLTSTEMAAWSPLCVEVHERINYGGDWGAYKAGVLRLLSDPRYRALPLIVANDSVYYLPNTGAIVADLISASSDVCATTVNKEFHPHVQSFLVRLSARTVQSGVVEDFFRHYRVRYSKSHAIRKGEIGFSRTLRRSGFTLDGLHGGIALSRALTARPDSLWAPELLRATDGPHVGRSMSKALSTRPGTMANPQLVIASLGLQMERRNATHALALTLARSLGTPLKLDLVRGQDSALEIVTALTGFADQGDLDDLSQWYSNAESPVSFKGLQGLYHHCGVG